MVDSSRLFTRRSLLRASVTGGAVLTAALVAACSSQPPAATPTNAAQPAAGAPAQAAVTHPTVHAVTGVLSTWTAHLPVLVAMHQGYFKDAGLNSVEWTKANGDAIAFASLISGSQDIAVHTSTDALARLVAKGEKMYILGATSSKLPHILFGTKGMTGLQDLKGKKIATDSGISVVDGYVERAVAPFGLKLSDFTMVRVGNSAERYKALANGVVDASPIGPSESPRAIEDGFPQLKDLAELYDDYVQRTYTVNGSFLNDHPQTVQAWMEGIVRAHRYLHDRANVDSVWQMLQADNYQVEERFYRPSLEAQLHLLPVSPLPSAKGVQIVLDEVGEEARGVTPDTLLRLGPLQEAIKKVGSR